MLLCVCLLKQSFKILINFATLKIPLEIELYLLNLSQGDCVSYQNIDGLDCAGKTSCQIPYKLKYLPECNNKLSNFITVKYDCVPGGFIFFYSFQFRIKVYKILENIYFRFLFACVDL